jgi:hypothetical protein
MHANAYTDALTPGNDTWMHLAGRARLLATLTLVWLGIEGTVRVWPVLSLAQLR